MTFKKGDKVRLTHAQNEVCAGATGVVYQKSSELEYDVVLDRKTVVTNDGYVWTGHSGDSRAKSGHWYCHVSNLAKVRKVATKRVKQAA